MKSDHAKFLEELVAECLASALIPPGILLARVEAERHRSVDRKGRVLADVIIRSGMAHLDGAVGGRVKRLQAGSDLARLESLDLKLVVGHLRDVFRKVRGAAV